MESEVIAAIAKEGIGAIMGVCALYLFYLFMKWQNENHRQFMERTQKEHREERKEDREKWESTVIKLNDEENRRHEERKAESRTNTEVIRELSSIIRSNKP